MLFKKALISLLFFSSSLWAGGVDDSNIIFSAEERAWMESHPVIRVANEEDWPPFDFNVAGKPMGMAIDHMELVAQKAGLELEYVYGYSWNELIRLFKNGEIDVMPVFYKNDERMEYTLYTNPYYRGKLGIFVKSHITVEDMDLIGKKVAMETSHGSIPLVKNKYPEINVIEIDSKKDLIQDLATDKIDAVIANPFVVYYLARENQIDNIHLVNYISMTNEEQLKTSMHIGVRADLPMLHQIIQKAMDNISYGEMEKITDKWADVSIVKQINWELVLQVSIITLFLFLLLAWNNRALNRKVKSKTEALRKLNEELETKVEMRTNELQDLNSRLEVLANNDMLTGLWNRRAIEPFFEKEMSRSNRFDYPVSMMLFDLDHFKYINDNHGHAVGDVVLYTIAQKMKSLIRQTDSIARWGGEEFIVLASDTTAENSMVLAEKIRLEISLMQFEEIEGVTISIGVSQYRGGESFHKWFERTDAALYKAKSRGRNCVIAGDETIF